MARHATATKVHEHANAISIPEPRRFRGHARSELRHAIAPGRRRHYRHRRRHRERLRRRRCRPEDRRPRFSLKEFSMPGVPPTIAVGDQVEVYLERVENALGEAVLSRDKARREESWIQLERAFNEQTRVTGVIFGRVKGGFTVDLDGAVAFLPGSQVDVRPMRDVGPLMNQPQPFQILKMDRRRGNIVVSRRAVLEERRAEERTSARRQPAGKAGGRRRGQEHHRLRCVRGSRRRGRFAPRHRHRLAPRQPSDGSVCRSARQSPCRSSRSITRRSASASA